MAKFLDENGVKKLWSRIQEYVYECCCSKGGGDVGYECKGGSETLWQGSVEADEFGRFPYTKQINADKLLVTFDNAVYECEKIVLPQINGYGGFDNGEPNFSKYPFAIVSGIIDDNAINELYVKDSGIHTLKIEADNTIITTTECFQKAVKSVGDSGYKCTTSFEEAFSESGATEVQKTSDTPSTTTLAYTGFIDADEITVVFNGEEYVCPKLNKADAILYGSTDMSFTDFPFMLGFSDTQGNILATKDPMSFSISVFAPVMTATVTPCFETAVKTVMGSGSGVKVVNVTGNPSSGLVLDTSCDEMEAIVKNGGYLVGQYNGKFFTLDEVPSEWKKESSAKSSAKASAPTLKIAVPDLIFSRVDIDSEGVIKRKCKISTKDCGVTYSEEQYPIK